MPIDPATLVPQINNTFLLPVGWIYFAVGASLILTVLKVIEAFVAVLKRPQLEVRLTKEVFFRLSDYGESIFANAILMVRNGDIEIFDVQFTLDKVNDSTKSFPVSPLLIGEKVRTEGTYSEHYFYTQSPKELIPDSHTRRVVYLTVLNDYVKAIQDNFSDFSKEVKSYKNHLLLKFGKITPDSQEDINVANGEIWDLSQKASSSITNHVQLEKGEYKLTICIQYRSVNSYRFMRLKEAKSSITFEVKSAVKENYKGILDNALYYTAFNILLDKTDGVAWPEYRPDNAKEVK